MSVAAPAIKQQQHEAILLIERNLGLARMLAEQLASDGYLADIAQTVQHARMLATACPPTLVLLGELDGARGTLDLLESIRQSSAGQREPAALPADIPVMVLASKVTHPDVLRAFDAGADDFLARPVHYLELRARLRALLRRTQPSTDSDPVTVIGPLRIDQDTCTVTLHGKPVTLRRKEFELLAHLASNPTRVFRRKELLDSVWGFCSAGNTRTVDSHASRLRNKLSAAGERWVISEWGVGYRLTGT